jgi:hypothetical protein
MGELNQLLLDTCHPRQLMLLMNLTVLLSLYSDYGMVLVFSIGAKFTPY